LDVGDQGVGGERRRQRRGAADLGAAGAVLEGQHRPLFRVGEDDARALRGQAQAHAVVDPAALVEANRQVALEFPEFTERRRQRARRRWRRQPGLAAGQ
tara:strand:- start:194 stop:490 length:297 start_codon:yes stop_codon:yes gene_type:complete